MFRKWNLFLLVSKPGFSVLPLALLLAGSCSGQQNKLAVRQADPVTVKRGGSVTQVLEVVVLPGFHVNNDKPRDESIIPLKLSWTGAGSGLDAKSVEYPKPEEISVGGLNLLVFTGMFRVKTTFQAGANAPVGPATVTGKIRYQACNATMCFRPSVVDVKVPVVIE